MARSVHDTEKTKQNTASRDFGYGIVNNREFAHYFNFLRSAATAEKYSQALLHSKARFENVGRTWSSSFIASGEISSVTLKIYENWNEMLLQLL